MTSSPDNYLKQMLEICTHKLELLKDMLELTKQQSLVIVEDTTDALLKIIDEKQKSIDAIDKLDEEFNAYFERLKFEFKVKNLNEMKADSIPGLVELQHCIGYIMQVTSDINELEKQNNVRAKSLLEDIGREIKKLNQGKKVNQLYSSKDYQSSAYFFDKKK